MRYFWFLVIHLDTNICVNNLLFFLLGVVEVDGFIGAFRMQAIDRWLYFQLTLEILNSLVLTRTNWTNSIDAIYSINANWIRRRCSIVHRICYISMGYFRYGNLYAESIAFGREIQYHKTDTEAFVFHDVHSIQQPIALLFRMCPLMWLHHSMLLQQQLTDFEMLSHCMCLFI